MRTATREDLACDPVGRYATGDGYLHFCRDARFWGVLLWGRPGRGDVEALVRSLAIELGPPAVRHVSLVDARRLAGVDAGAFGALRDYVEAEREALARQVERLAIVRPDGMEGALVAGFFEVLPKPYPTALFASCDEALAWLEVDDPARVSRELDELWSEAAATPPIVAAIAALLEEHIEVSIGQAAKRLAMSERTLQRRLREAGTSFVDQVNSARIAAAKRLLIDSDAPITQIALEVGCASPQHFSALFRRLTGATPSAFRTRHKR